MKPQGSYLDEFAKKQARRRRRAFWKRGPRISRTVFWIGLIEAVYWATVISLNILF